jgi:exopolyphosphatase / guanosine-5'-triphosphate,3'-diphosphate pyrophosphatase
VFLQGKLAPAAVSQACESLRRFREILDLHKVERYRAVATSAVREAENGSTLVERARREAGIELDVIEGIEEARLVRLAIVGRLDLRDKRALLLDLGGGSLEVSLIERGQLRFSKSLPIGTVRLLEAFHGATDDAEEMAREYIERQLLEIAGDIPKGAFDVCVGTGGNFDTLAQLCPPPELDPQKPTIDLASVAALLPRLAAMSTDDRRTTYGLRPDRADVIVPAAEIVIGVAKTFNIDRIYAPGIGLKEGVLDEIIEKHYDVWDYGGEANASLDAALRLGRRYHFDEAHGVLVARLSADLFDQLLPLHRLNERDRLLLRTAALLHDVGDFVRYEGHHRHSQYLLTNSDIVGLTPNERAIVANVARYHRKAHPDTSHPSFRDLDRDSRSRVRVLSAIVRIADALDREHAAKVTGVRAVIEKGRMKLHLTGARERRLEEWTVGRKSQLFEEVFDLAVDIARV